MKRKLLRAGLDNEQLAVGVRWEWFVVTRRAKPHVPIAQFRRVPGRELTSRKYVNKFVNRSNVV